MPANDLETGCTVVQKNRHILCIHKAYSLKSELIITGKQMNSKRC